MTTAQRSEAEIQRELEKMERFRRVASLRANAALGYMEKLLRTADRSRYSYTPEQAEEVLSKFRIATDRIAAAYAGQQERRLKVEL